MAVEKYIIDKSDLGALLRGENLAIQPKGNIRGFCVEITGNLTNGDVIKALFPQMGVNEDWKATRSGQILSKDKKYVDISFACTSDWWNAQYKVERSDKE